MPSAILLLRRVAIAAIGIVFACDQPGAPSASAPSGLPGPRYGGHGGGGTVTAEALQLNGLIVDGHSCMGDDALASGLLNGVKSASDIKCTSNDIALTSMIVTAYSYDGSQFFPVPEGQPISCIRGTTIFVSMAGLLSQTGSSDRTDVGVWISYDGGDAISGSCQQYTLQVGVDPATLNVDGDRCGDFAANASTSIPFDVIGLQCEDHGTGTLSVGTCIGWKNSGSDATCPANQLETDEGYRFGSIPGQKSKCNCSSVQLPVAVSN